MPGTATIVLHTHLPYCRLAGRWPHGEEWLHEALLECYLPLLGAFRRLAADVHGSLGVTINITPILAEQLRDPVVLAHFREYLDGRIERARNDAGRFAGDPLPGKTARFHLQRYSETRRLFEDDLGGDILGSFADLEASGHLEIATSAATHAYLPLLEDEDAVRFQVMTGIESHLRNFGRRPRSFWLPECAYRPGMERVLEEAGIEVFFVETHLVTGGRARGKALGGMVGPYPALEREEPETRAAEQHGTTFRPYRVGSSNVAVLARNEQTGLQVWSAAHGYPGDAAYREFHKKDDVSGLHYWRVTSRELGLGEKAEYDAAAAAGVAAVQASHFRDLLKRELFLFEHGAGEPGNLVAAYDTELFGHWWLEGVSWLEHVIRLLANDVDVTLASAAEVVRNHPPDASIELPEGSWGAGGDHRTWMNDETAWTWPQVRRRQHQAHTLLREGGRLARQLARELLLLQASDWQFLMTTGQAHDYAVERFNSHAARFDAIATAIESRDDAFQSELEQLEDLDNPFPDIAPRRYGARPGGVLSR
jgi:1,4-alpha-glucan branching enzyme